LILILSADSVGKKSPNNFSHNCLFGARPSSNRLVHKTTATREREALAIE
jgi:hypothetical protein